MRALRHRGYALALLAGASLAALAQGPAPGLAPGSDTAHTIVIPSKLVAGKRATLAVVDAEGKLAAGVEVEFGGGVTLTTDQTGRASFTAPEEPGVVTVRLAGGAARATSTVMRAGEHPADELILDDVPTLVAIGSRFTVSGYGFRGQADDNLVTIGEQPAIVLAASPIVLVLAPHPQSQPGPAEFRIETGDGQAVTFSTTVVRLEVSAEKPQLAPRERGQLTVRAHGTLTRVEIEARNLTPEIVRLRDGVVQRATTRGGIENTATFRLEGRAQGEYQIAVRLMPPPLGLPDTERALRHLIRAIALSPNEPMRQRILRQVHRLEAHPHDLPRVRDALEGILSEYSEGEFGRQVEAAWKALLKR